MEAAGGEGDGQPLAGSVQVSCRPSPTPPSSLYAPHQDTQADLEGLQSSSDDGDYTWTPTRRVLPLPMAGRKARKGRASRHPPQSKESKKAPGTPQMKKKCVNGFIMFCRMNRKQYIRWVGVLFDPERGPASLSIHSQG